MKKRAIIFSATVGCIIASAFALCGCGATSGKTSTHKWIYVKYPWGVIEQVEVSSESGLICGSKYTVDKEKVGYSFIGYYNSASGGMWYNSIGELPAGTIVYAQYSPNYYQVKLYNEGDDVNTVEPMEKISLLYDEHISALLPIPTNMPFGAAFDGWFGGKNGDMRISDETGAVIPDMLRFYTENGYMSYEKGAGFYASYEMKVYPFFAKYKYPKYTVTLDYGTEHGLETTETECAHGGVPDLPQLTDGDYIIKEWSTDALGYDVYDGAGVTEDTTFYAIWRRHRYVGLWSGGEKIRELSLFEDDSVSLDEFGLEYPNKIFDGWYTDPEFDPSTRVFTAVYADYNALYAKWIDL